MKESKFAIMKSLDQFVFDQVSNLKETPSLQKLFEKYNILEEPEQKKVNFALMAFSLIVPFSFIFMFFLFLNSSKNELQLKEEIIQKASEIIAKKKQMDIYTRSVFGNELNSEASFKNKVTTLLSNQGIDTSKVQITDFLSTDNYGITNANAKLVFNALSDKSLFKIIKALFVIEKFKVESINISKNKENNLLDGNFNISYFSKQSESR